MSIYVRLLIVVFCISVVVRAPEPPDNTSAAPRETKQKLATVAERKQTLTALLSSADSLRRAKETQKAVLTLNDAGRLQLDLGKTKDALSTFQQSHSLLESVQGTDPITTIDTLNSLASAYVELSDYVHALPLIDEARTKSEQNNYPAGKAEALLLLSECQNSNNHATALDTANAALSLWQSVGDVRGVVRTYLQIGQYQMAQTMLVEAAQSFQSALDGARTLGDAKLQAESLVYQGYVHFREGAWQDLFDSADEASRLIDAEAEPFLMGQITSGFADSYIETGSPNLGLQKFQQALEYYSQTEYPDAIVGTLWGIGKAHYFLGHYNDALAKFQESLAGAEAQNLKRWIAQNHEYLGRTYEAQGQHEQALTHYDAALSLYSTLGNSMEAARVQALIGQVNQTQGDLAKAYKLYQEALEKFVSLNDRINQSATLFRLGNVDLQSGNYNSAEIYFKQSIEITENIRRLSTSRDLTTALSATVHDRYERYIQCLMHHNQDEATTQAFEISESARARSLAEFLRGTGTNLLDNIDPELAAREKTLRQRLRDKEDVRVALFSGKYDKAQLESLDAELARLEDEYKSLSLEISRRHPTYDQLTRPRSWDLARIQKEVIVDDDTILLEYSIGVDKSYVWAVTRNSFTGHELSGAVGKAADTVYNLLKNRSKAGNESELTDATQALAQMIVAPVADQLNKRRVIVVADGALNYIPFQILPSGTSNNEPLVVQHKIINTPSASILGELREEAAGRSSRSKLVAAFGDPVIDRTQRSNEVAFAETQSKEHLRTALRDIELNGDGFDPTAIGDLFYAEREIDNLRDIASPARTFAATKYAANRKQLFSLDLSQYAILHFATHGFLDPKHPENSGLLLSMLDEEGNDQRGFIELKDVYSLRAPVDLVVLSACRTALGQDVRGEGLVGLTRGFMYAGATTVVASLWKVDDEATSELMKRFYTEMLQNGQTPDEALRIAQNRIREKPEWHAPHYWAGFILQGEYRYVVNSERSWRRYSTVLVVGIAMIVLIAVAGWYRYRVVLVSALKK